MQASVGSLLFGDLDEYSGFVQVFIAMFSTGLGNYNYTIFASSALGELAGEIFIVLCVTTQAMCMSSPRGGAITL